MYKEKSSYHFHHCDSCGKSMYLATGVVIPKKKNGDWCESKELFLCKNCIDKLIVKLNEIKKLEEK